MALCVAAAASWMPATAQEPARRPAEDARQDDIGPRHEPSLQDIERWTLDLGHDEFSVRQAAAEKLIAAGSPAREPLAALADGPDPETRAAARRLISIIDRSEFSRRLEAFAADTEGRDGVTLPGWKRFRKLVGADPAARELFVEMQRQEGPLLAAIFDGSARPPDDLWESRIQRLLAWQSLPGAGGAESPLGSCATILFLGAAGEIKISDSGIVNIDGLIQRPPLSNSLRADSVQDPVRRLVVSWILYCPSQNEGVLARRLALVANLNLAEGVALALGVVKGDPKYPAASPGTKALALQLIGQFGGREHVAELEPLLEDVSVCIQPHAPAPGQQVVSVQIRDVALAVMLLLTDQQPARYGYASARLVMPQRIYQLPSLGRTSDEERAQSIAQWRAWRASQTENDAEKPANGKN
jgi:hypothetical protein